MTTRTTDALVRIKDELEPIYMALAEAEMDDLDELAKRMQSRSAIRARLNRIWRGVGLGEPPAFRTRANVIRETEAVAS